MISEAEARRILDLPERATRGQIRAHAADQRRRFTEARELAHDDAERARLDRALTLTDVARDRLLGRPVAQDTAGGGGPFPLRHLLIALSVGVFMVVVGLQPDPDAEDSAPATEPGVTEAPEAATPVGAQAPAPTVPGTADLRQRLDPVRAALVAAWRDAEGRVVLPATTDLEGLDLPAPPQGWRWSAQRDGIFGLRHTDGDQWLLAAPIVRDGELRWGCVTSLGALGGCLTLSGAGPLGDAVAAGALDVFGLARVLEGLTADARSAAYDPDLWLRHALSLGDPRAGRRLAERILAAAPDEAERREAWSLFEFAFAGFAEQGDVTTAAGVASAFAYHLAMHDAGTRELAAGWLVRCRDMLAERGTAEAVCAQPADFGYALEVAALETGDFTPARWWYEQAVAEQSAAGAEGLTRMLALGRTGEVERQRALALLQDASERWSSFDQQRAAVTAAEVARSWEEGWGIGADPEQAFWWHAQAARMGHVGSALQLASSFVLGAGVERNTERARQVVDMFGEYSPLFEFAFYRTVGERLETGRGVAAEPDAAGAWYRRAFDLVRALAEDGDTDARLELAGMYFEGRGVDRDAAQAARLYQAVLEDAPVRAGNMLAWIRATAMASSLRDGDDAVRLARRVVALARSADHLDTLAAALAESGAFEEAAATQQAALEMLAANADPLAVGADVADRRAEFQTRLAAYRAGRPWRDEGRRS